MCNHVEYTSSTKDVSYTNQSTECFTRCTVLKATGFSRGLPITRAITFLAQSSTTTATSNAFQQVQFASMINSNREALSFLQHTASIRMTPFMSRRKLCRCAHNSRTSRSCGRSNYLDSIATTKTFRSSHCCSTLRRGHFREIHMTLTLFF
jgi:hypothetical protein